MGAGMGGAGLCAQARRRVPRGRDALGRQAGRSDQPDYVHADGRAPRASGMGPLDGWRKDVDHLVRRGLHSQDPDMKPASVALLLAVRAWCCEGVPEARQFDFWIGEWNVEVAGKVVARSSIRRIEGSCIVLEHW